MNIKIKDRNNLAYVIGIAIGDGNLSNPNRRAVRLRITCDAKYRMFVNNIFTANCSRSCGNDNEVGI